MNVTTACLLKKAKETNQFLTRCRRHEDAVVNVHVTDLPNHSPHPLLHPETASDPQIHTSPVNTSSSHSITAARLHRLAAVVALPSDRDYCHGALHRAAP